MFAGAIAWSTIREVDDQVKTVAVQRRFCRMPLPAVMLLSAGVGGRAQGRASDRGHAWRGRVGASDRAAVRNADGRSGSSRRNVQTVDVSNINNIKWLSDLIEKRPRQRANEWAMLAELRRRPSCVSDPRDACRRPLQQAWVRYRPALLWFCCHAFLSL